MPEDKEEQSRVGALKEANERLRGMFLDMKKTISNQEDEISALGASERAFSMTLERLSHHLDGIKFMLLEGGSFIKDVRDKYELLEADSKHSEEEADRLATEAMHHAGLFERLQASLNRSKSATKNLKSAIALGKAAPKESALQCRQSDADIDADIEKNDRKRKAQVLESEKEEDANHNALASTAMKPGSKNNFVNGNNNFHFFSHNFNNPAPMFFTHGNSATDLAELGFRFPQLAAGARHAPPSSSSSQSPPTGSSSSFSPSTSSGTRKRAKSSRRK